MVRDQTLVVSFDIDGTVQFGDPAGPIRLRIMKELQEAQVIVGSASDRTVHDQRRLWHEVGFVPEFVVVKNHLRFVSTKFPSSLLVHVGDRFADELEASNAGALFIHVDALSPEQWLDLDHFYRKVRSMRPGDAPWATPTEL